jgi:hypothetical protein
MKVTEVAGNFKIYRVSEPAFIDRDQLIRKMNEKINKMLSILIDQFCVYILLISLELK